MLWLAGMLVLPVNASMAGSGYRQVSGGVVVYYGIVPAQIIESHPPAHPEAAMHGGPVVGDNHHCELWEGAKHRGE